MKKLITTTAIGLMLALPAHAEDKANANATAEANANASANMSGDMFMKSIPDSFNASGLMGKRVYISKDKVDAKTAINEAQDNWDDVGEVSDVVIGTNGEVDAVLVDVGGFLGIGEKTVAISMDSLNLIPDGDTDNSYFVVAQGSKDQLDQAPKYDAEMQTAFSAEANGDKNGNGEDMQNADASQQMDEAGDHAEAAAKATATAAGAAANEAANETAQAADNAGEAIDNAAENTADAAQNAAQETEQAMNNAGDKTEEMAKDAAQNTKEAANATGQAVENAAENAGEATKEAANETGNAIDDAVDSTAAAVGTMGQADQEDGQKVDIASVAPDTLRGEGVYGPNDDKVGDVSELVQGNDGKVSGVVIDVGGFLGIGAKPVEIKASELTVLQNDTSITVHTGLTEDQLKKLPKYEAK
ncbi:PRC-barrel domain protein [Thioclava sp. ES.031]|uniref:PRC-barrel domain-containing protein n=1 Tax=Thioclava sp. ES.031 TaxID=1798203 RepID=UPI000BF7D609|nr:PRC-barrel domain-containing protein [Thioclava sp. ES.031]PFG64520.1 PRC-barrel domain protein [Thioclava sp. ES.031]